MELGIRSLRKRVEPRRSNMLLLLLYPLSTRLGRARRVESTAQICCCRGRILAL